MNKVLLSPDIRFKLRCLLDRASYLRDEIKHSSIRGWADAVTFYRRELRLRVAEARALVKLDFAVQALTSAPAMDLGYQEYPAIDDCISELAEIRDRLSEARNAPVQVSETPVFRRLFLLCVLVQSKGRITSQPLQCLPRLRAPRPSLSGQWPLVLPAPLRLRAVSGQAPTLAQLDRCTRYRRADSFRSYSRTF